MNTTKNIPSPFQTRNVIDVRSKNHPVRDEIVKLCSAVYNIEVSFEEDKQTLSHFSHIPGLIAILCTLKKDGQVVAFGRSCAVFSKFNKYIERTISTALNGSFLSATNNATKVFEALRVFEGGEQNKESESVLYQENEPASDKQKVYLRSLVEKNVSDEEKRSKWQALIDKLTKDEASEKIKYFVNNY